MLDQLRQGMNRSPQRVLDTIYVGRDETDNSGGRRKVLSKKTYKMKKIYAAEELGRIFVTGPIDEINKLSPFHCGVCKKDVPVLYHGP